MYARPNTDYRAETDWRVCFALANSVKKAEPSRRRDYRDLTIQDRFTFQQEVKLDISRRPDQSLDKQGIARLVREEYAPIFEITISEPDSELVADFLLKAHTPKTPSNPTSP
jgi:hypothetical protein